MVWYIQIELYVCQNAIDKKYIHLLDGYGKNFKWVHPNMVKWIWFKLNNESTVRCVMLGVVWIQANWINSEPLDIEILQQAIWE